MNLIQNRIFHHIYSSHEATFISPSHAEKKTIWTVLSHITLMLVLVSIIRDIINTEVTWLNIGHMVHKKGHEPIEVTWLIIGHIVHKKGHELGT